ncbi:MAG: ATP-binding protein [Deltaproteobacteria bacterium]|nr:MAG: ATP-binding protein [Deltaproteobacteria bacterium]
MTYLERNLKKRIDDFLTIFPVVLIIGARQTGKTTLVKKCRPEWRYFDLEKGSDFDFITNDFDFFFREYPEHLIIDEAQESPQLFRELRGVIDSDRQKKGRFILTGSSSPDLLKGISDSLAGRVGILEIGTLKMNEQTGQPLSNFYQLFMQPLHKRNIDLIRQLPLLENDCLDIFLKGGYPEPIQQQSETAYYTWMDNYHKTYISTDIKRLYPKLDSIKYRRFIGMLAELSGTIVNKAQLGRSIDTSEVTVRDYLDIADKSFIWRSIPSYENSMTKSVVKMPKGIYRDSGLLHYLLNIFSRDQMLQNPSVGHSFESFVIEEILKGMQATMIPRWNYYYYRTRNGAEIDLILEGSFGLLPIEIKFGSSTTMKQLTSLNKFIKEQALPFGVVINNSEEIRLLNKKIVQVPVKCI